MSKSVRDLYRSLIFLIASMLALVPAGGAVEAVAFDWELKKESDGIAVYTSDVHGSKHKAVKAEMTVSGSLNGLVGLVRDTGACSEWADLCREAVELEHRSDTELLVYTYNDIPWPVSDRDAITSVLWEQNPDTRTVTMTAVAVDDPGTRKTKAVRIVKATTRWFFTPLGDGKIKVTTEAHLEPGGPTPAWLTNMLLIDSPLKTMSNMRALLGTGRYDDVSYSFIRER